LERFATYHHLKYSLNEKGKKTFRIFLRAYAHLHTKTDKTKKRDCGWTHVVSHVFGCFHKSLAPKQDRSKIGMGVKSRTARKGCWLGEHCWPTRPPPSTPCRIPPSSGGPWGMRGVSGVGERAVCCDPSQVVGCPQPPCRGGVSFSLRKASRLPAPKICATDHRYHSDPTHFAASAQDAALWVVGRGRGQGAGQRDRGHGAGGRGHAEAWGRAEGGAERRGRAAFGQIPPSRGSADTHPPRVEGTPGGSVGPAPPPRPAPPTLPRSPVAGVARCG